MALSAKPATFTVNTSATWCPDTLWMCDEGTGTSLSDIGKSAGTYNNDGTLSAVGTGGTPSWATDGTHGDYINIDSSSQTLPVHNGGVIKSANACSFTTQYSAILVARVPTITSGSGVALCVGDKDLNFLFDDAFVYNDKVNPYSNQLGEGSSGAADVDGGSTWHVIALKRKNGELAVSVDGAAWVVKTGTDTLGWPSYDGYGFPDQIAVGAKGVSGSSQECMSLDVLAVAFYRDVYLSDANISTIYNSGDVWSSFGITTAVKKLKLLAHPSAASATGVEGWVVDSDNTTYYGKFTGGAFEASLESGQAVLKVAVADFSGTALTTSDTPLVVVRNTTYGTTMCDATVIEE